MEGLKPYEICWQKMTIVLREAFVKSLMKSIPSFDSSWWGGLSAEELSEIDDPDKAPTGFAGSLLVAFDYVGNNFSIAESERARALMNQKEHEK